MTMHGNFFIRVHDALEQRSDERRDRGSALLTTIVFMILLASLSTILLGIVLASAYPTDIAQARAKTVYAAEAGLQTTLGQIRSAAAAPDLAGDIYGSLAELPCTVTGAVDGASGSSDTFTAEVRYFIGDPSNESEAWREANEITCSTVGGVSSQPYFALIESTGNTVDIDDASADAGSRSLAAVYEFEVSNENILGGLIQDFDRGFCLQADSATVGSEISYVANASCTDANKALQFWTYDTDWHIRLASTIETATPLCITGPITITTTTPGSTTTNTVGPTRGTTSNVTTYSVNSSFSPTVSPTPPGSLRGTPTAISSVTAPLVTVSNTTVAGVTTLVQREVVTTITRETWRSGGRDTQYYKRVVATTNLTTVTTVTTIPPSTATTLDPKAKLQACVTSGAARWNQLWSWTGNATWFGMNAAMTGTTGYCLGSGVNAALNTARDLMVGTTCASQVAWGSFAPVPAVGAGAAGFATRQIVSFKEFGRCADVTDTDLAKTFMIVYPCKQDPTGTGVNLAWNHKWYYAEPTGGATTSAVQQVKVLLNDINNAANDYCMQTPASGATIRYVTFTATCSATTDRQKWVRYQDTGQYSSSYLFVDHYGRCLTADSSDVYSGNWSKMTVAACNGSTAQKWNAPAAYTDSGFGGYKEIAK